MDLTYLTPAVTAYVTAAGLAPTTEQLESALRAEAADQGNRCRIPADTMPPALVEALCRRVAHNIAVRPLPLGVQMTITDAAAATTSIGGTDAEVRRLEGPYRKRVVG